MRSCQITSGHYWSLAAGETVEEILDAHPRLSREGIQAALRFGARALRADVVYPIAVQG